MPVLYLIILLVSVIPVDGQCPKGCKLCLEKVWSCRQVKWEEIPCQRLPSNLQVLDITGGTLAARNSCEMIKMQCPKLVNTRIWGCRADLNLNGPDLNGRNGGDMEKTEVQTNTSTSTSISITLPSSISPMDIIHVEKKVPLIHIPAIIWIILSFFGGLILGLIPMVLLVILYRKCTQKFQGFEDVKSVNTSVADGIV